VIKFKEFELNCDRYELCRNGRAVRLEKMPMELLILLVTKKGNLVTRQEIVACLWGTEVFIDSEHGINTVVRKLRQALHDDPDKPRFVQTVTGKGYRFVMQAIEVDEPAAEENKTGSISSLNGATLHSAAVATEIQEAESDLKGQDAPASPSRETGRRRSLLFVAVGSLVALGSIASAISWIRLDWTDRFSNRSAKLHIESLAVIPLENLSGDPNQEYFADGMTDELITMLAKNSTLRVISRTSVQYKGAHRPVRDIAKELSVDGILEGSVTRSGNDVHLTLQLIEASTDTHIWADSYDRDTKDSISLPREAARTIATRLGRVSSHEGFTRYISPRAHDIYIRGLYYQHTGNYDKAVEAFKAAVQLQPDYALAWNELAFSYGYISIANRPSIATPKAKAAIQKALELDDSLAEAHNNVAGMACFYDWDWILP
jgi:TolB-like protein/DNA-binding winged helix-turn-helix (wHTH) protein